jgi:hypothetical protein
MAATSLEKRVAQLESQMAEMKAVLRRLEGPKDWRSTVGMFANDEGMRQIFDEAIKIREADRAKARKRLCTAKAD